MESDIILTDKKREQLSIRSEFTEQECNFIDIPSYSVKETKSKFTFFDEADFKQIKDVCLHCLVYFLYMVGFILTLEFIRIIVKLSGTE